MVRESYAMECCPIIEAVICMILHLCKALVEIMDEMQHAYPLGLVIGRLGVRCRLKSNNLWPTV
jgi:hypothetical protein